MLCASDQRGNEFVDIGDVVSERCVTKTRKDCVDQITCVANEIRNPVSWTVSCHV